MRPEAKRKKPDKKRPGIVTLITDFGLTGEYTGAMKGAILTVNPFCQVVDVTHQIQPQNILQAAYVLKNTYPYFPPGAVHLVVVDPGVGTWRRPVILKKEEHFFVGPDNGVFTFISSGQQIEGYEIIPRKIFRSPLSRTFHGRDIFAPVAGYLARGVNPERFGPPAENWQTVAWPNPAVKGKKLVGKIIFVDSYGNLITNISRQDYGALLASRPFQIKGKGWRINRLHDTYDRVASGEPLALFGSSGLLEIAVNRGDAHKTLSLNQGDLLSLILS